MGNEYTNGEPLHSFIRCIFVDHSDPGGKIANAAEQKPALVDDGLGGLTYRVIGLAMAVHNDLGPGHREATYHNAMTQRFVDAGLAAETSLSSGAHPGAAAQALGMTEDGRVQDATTTA